MTQKEINKIYNKNQKIDDVTLLREKLSWAFRHRPDIKYVDIFNEKIVPTMSHGKRQKFNKFLIYVNGR